MRQTPFVAACVFVMSGAAALAQSPSANDIISSLKPSASQLKGPTRGIRPVVTAPDDAQPAPTPSHGQPRTQRTAHAEAPSVKLVVDFRTGSAELSPGATMTLDNLGRALSSDALGAYHFRVEGHTDTVGTPDSNKDLSQRRAQTVTDYLTQKFRISPDRLVAVGLGSSDLLVPTPDQTPEPRNRRVRIVNLGAG